MAVSITTLVENENLGNQPGLTAEFGLSLLIEAGGRRVLFDTGASGVFADNAALLGIDLQNIDAGVLSHHHFDHGGGIERFFEVNESAPVYTRKAPLKPRQFRLFGLLKRDIGLDLGLFDQCPSRLVEITAETEIIPGFTLLTNIGDRHPRPPGNRRLWVETEDGPVRDSFDHELVMVVHDAEGMVVFTGCSHTGVLNMVDAAREAFPNTPVSAVVGGFHLIGLPWFNSMAVSRAEAATLAGELADRCDGMIITGHCTGQKGTDALRAVLGDRLKTFRTGSQIVI